jgi:hypothetical protein
MRTKLASLVVIASSLGLSAHVRAQEPPADTCAIEGFTSPLRLVQDEVLAQWNSEALAQAPFGAPGTFDLDAAELHVTFDTSASVVAPVNALALSSSVTTTWSFNDVVIDGVGSGRLDVSGAFTASNARVTAASIVQIDTGAGAASMTVLPEGISLDVNGATLAEYNSATLVDASGTSTTLGATVTLASAGAFVAASDSGLVHVVVENVSISTSGAFALAGDFTGGALAVEGETFATPARTILAASGDMLVDPSGVTGAARVTQVFDDTAPLMQAEVEIVVLAPVASVTSGGSINVPALVRNKSARATAILAGIEVDGCGASAVKPVVDETPPSMVAILVGAIENAGWAAPFVAVTVAPLLGVALLTDAFVAVADAFVDAIGDIFCGLFGCDDTEPPPAPVPPIPYPKWLAPGQVAVFEIALLPQIGDDDYPTRVRFIGNHPEAHVDFTLRVGRGDVPAAWQCGLDQWGNADGCHCGCGARDADCPADATLASCDVDACAPGFNHLEESSIDVCIQDPQPPPPNFDDDDFDDDDDDDDFRFDCASTSAASPWVAGCVVLFALLRRRGSRRNSAT